MVKLSELYEIAEQFTLENFNIPFKCKIEIEEKVHRNTYGAYYYTLENGKVTPRRIGLAVKLFHTGSREFVIDVLKHEVVHYALSIKGLPYRDKDFYFKSTCKKLGVSISSDWEKYNLECHHYQCNCKVHKSNIKFRKSRFCKLCKGELVYLGKYVFREEVGKWG